MDNRYDRRLAGRKRARGAAAFLRRNGLYLAMGLCLAVLGVTAAVIFASGGKPAENSLDQRLGEATRLTPAPTAEPTNAPVSLLPHAHRTPAPLVEETPSVQPTPVAELTPAPSQKSAEASENPMLQSPCGGSVSRVFAMDCLIYSKTLNQWMTHPGVDIAAPKGAEVRCVAAGKVTRVYTDDMLGVTVEIDHGGGMTTRYCSLKEQPPVAVGQEVEARALIGYVGSTAISECAEQSHLHFELYSDGLPVDPEKYVLIAQR